jgi:hypothetical protein
MDIRHSRTLRLAEGASGQSEQTLAEQLEKSLVSIAFADDENSRCTAEILVETLRRMPIRLSVAPNVSDSDKQAMARIAEAIDPVRSLEASFVGDEPDVLVVIGESRPDATVSGVPVHHGALVVSGSLNPEGWKATPASGLGVFTCAALLAGEVFKRIAQVLPARAIQHGRISWCPVTLTDDPWGTPVETWALDENLALVGLGAIGTATARILDLLKIEGCIQLVDPERFGPENLGTYSLGSADAAQDEPWKVELAAAALPRMDCETFVGTAAEYIRQIDEGNRPWPSLVLAGLDTPEARRQVQRLWPDRLIDGATGDTMCGLHDVRFGEGSCLICLFPERHEGPSAAERLADATGLPIDLVRKGDRQLLKAHLDGLDRERQKQLAPMLGKPICGLAEAVGLTELDSDDFRPSVPFVSQQAACMVVGRAIASAHGIAHLPNFVQYDALIGSENKTLENRHPAPTCRCQHRRGLIKRVRELRARSMLRTGRGRRHQTAVRR